VRFQATHKLFSYLLVGNAMATLASSNALPPLGAGLLIGFAAISWFAEPGTSLANILDRLSLPLRLLALAFFALAAWQLWQRLPEPDLTPILNLVMFLLAFKLFHRRGNRDYLQIYILSFLLVLAAAALAQSFLFAVSFAGYVVLATWTLILFHLRREMEENYLVKHSAQAPSEKVGVNRILNSRRVVGGAFFAATGLIALTVFAGSIATFAIVPRIGAGFVLGGPRPTRNLIGFSDDVTLGQYGILSTDNQVVALRATMPRIAAIPNDRARDREIERLYWRGTVYDTYDRGHWVRSRRPELRTEIDDEGYALAIREPRMENPHRGGDWLRGADRQEIDVVGVSVPVVFALDHPIGVELPAAKLGTVATLKLAPRWSGEVAMRIAPLDSGINDSEDARAYGGTHYVAYSRDSLSMARASAGRPLRDVDPAVLEPYLALPTSLSPRVTELARQITAGRVNPPAKLVALMDWLRTTHEYTTNLPRHPPGVDPLEDFLFENKAGHCEYFASAITVLLRASGIPSRYVNGFLGGEWNDIGRYITVRDNRAHSWAEAYVGEIGWVRVDATPAAPAGTRWSRLRQLIDSVDFFWTRWVVGYDIGRQIELARKLGRRMGVTSSPSSDHSVKIPVGRQIGIIVGVALAVWVVWRFARRPWRTPRPRTHAWRPPADAAPVVRLYHRVLDRLARRGLGRRSSETPREHARRVVLANVRGSDELERLANLYGAARFGARPVDDEVVRDLGRALRNVGLPLHPDAS
jgi:transglutaminase-like putative cysteine protease